MAKTDRSPFPGLLLPVSSLSEISKSKLFPSVGRRFFPTLCNFATLPLEAPFRGQYPASSGEISNLADARTFP